MKKPTKFLVLDVETDGKDNVVDLGYCLRTRQKILDHGGFLLMDVFARKGSYYSKDYLGMAARKEITPITFCDARDHINALLNSLDGRVIICAYNAQFDRRALNKTSLREDGKFFLDKYYEWMDIWRAWADSAPKCYRELAPSTASGKYVSTTAESVYQFEFQDPFFQEAHTGEADALIESDILDKVLKRKKKLPINNLKGQVWRDFEIPDYKEIAQQQKEDFLRTLAQWS